MYYDSLFEFVLDALKWNPERYTESQRAKAIYNSNDCSGRLS